MIELCKGPLHWSPIKAPSEHGSVFTKLNSKKRLQKVLIPRQLHRYYPLHRDLRGLSDYFVV